MGSSSKRLALLGAWIGALLLATAIISAHRDARRRRRPAARRAWERRTSRFACIARQGRLRRRSCSTTSTTTQGTNATSSQNFESSFDTYDDELADDFVVPSGQTWNINQVDAGGVYYNGAGPAVSANVSFYCERVRSSGLAGGHEDEPVPDRLSGLVRDPDSIGGHVEHRHVLGLGAGEHGLQLRRPVGLRRPHRPEQLGSCLAEPGRRLRRLPELGRARHDLRDRPGRSGSGLASERDDRRPTAATASATASAAATASATTTASTTTTSASTAATSATTATSASATSATSATDGALPWCRG